MNLFYRPCLRAKIVPSLMAMGLLACAAGAQASGGDPPPAGPLPRIAPAMPLTLFAKGQLGILDSTYQRAYLVAAWRVLDGAPLTDRDLAMLTNALSGETANALVNAKGEKPWAEARKRYGDAADEVSYLSGSSLEAVKNMPGLADPAAGANEYLSYSNCNFSATKAAAETLTARAKQYGDARQNKWVKEWIKGQDQVFNTCEGVYEEPVAAPADAPQWFKYDRQYQRAAALMYASRFAEARAAFEAIASDVRSPWSELAPYLAARVVLRQASLTVTPELHATRLAQARQLFDKLARTGTPEQRRLAKPMLGRIAVELDPGAVLAKANVEVGSTKWTPETEGQLGNLLTLIRKSAERREGSGTAEANDPYFVKEDGSMADWILSFGQAPQVNPVGAEWDRYEPIRGKDLATKALTWCAHALKPTHKAAWTIACLAGSAKWDAVPAAVWQYATNIDVKHPAYASVSYHVARLQLDNLSDASAPAVASLRTQLDRQMTLGAAVYGIDGMNAMRLLRARLATSLPEYVQLSTFTVLAEPERYAWYSDRARASSDVKGLYPSVPAYLTYGLSVDELTQALGQPGALPPDLRKATVGMAWARAALLRQAASLAALTPLLLAEVPGIKPELDAFQGASDAAAKQFELVQLLLQHEDLDLARVQQMASFGGHWGTLKAPKMDGFRVLKSSPAALKEQALLKKLGTYTDFVGETALAYAALAPQDPRLPETLATVVALTRREAVTSPTLSKRAFTALHKLYPQSKAAKRTKYWY